MIPDKRKVQFLEFFEQEGGNISAACKRLNISRPTYYAWINDPDFGQAVEDIKEGLIDHVESKLMQRINGYEEDDVHITNYQGDVTITPIKKIYPPDPTSIIFYLKTKAKHRGYIERQEVEHSGQVVNITEERTYPDGKN